VTYHRKNNPSPDLEMGLIAQEVEATLEQLGIKNLGLLHKDDNGYLSLRYNDLIGVIVKAIQEQQTEIEDLQDESQNLDNEYKAIATQTQKLSAQLKVISARLSTPNASTSFVKIAQ